MANRSSNNAKCQKYLNEKKRIKNKTEELEKRISKFKDEVRDKIKKSCLIGREKEGFKKEDFKFRPRKKHVAA
jgi:hypothetical protein